MTFIMAAIATLRRVPFWAWAAIFLLVAGFWYGQSEKAEGVAEERARWEAKAKKAYAEYRAREESWRKAVYDLAYQAEAKAREVKAENDAAIAGLRDGTLRVRDRFRCPVSGNPPSAGRPDPGPAGFQPEDAATALGITAEADQLAIKYNQCIASYNAMRDKP